jgi:hypothetical protein
MNPQIRELDYASLRPFSPFGEFTPSVNARRCKKRTYMSKRDALTARNAALQRRHHRPDFLRAYPCAECCGWHLTHLAPLD